VPLRFVSMHSLWFRVNEEFAVLLARLETKLDLALSRGDDHESRIRILERKVWQAAGIATIVSGSAAAGLAQVLSGR
jgi:hypothetical protein